MLKLDLFCLSINDENKSFVTLTLGPVFKERIMATAPYFATPVSYIGKSWSYK
jgi:hypothetical protein